MESPLSSPHTKLMNEESALALTFQGGRLRGGWGVGADRQRWKYTSLQEKETMTMTMTNTTNNNHMTLQDREQV